jgi:hypothetical protein
VRPSLPSDYSTIVSRLAILTIFRRSPWLRLLVVLPTLARGQGT